MPPSALPGEARAEREAILHAKAAAFLPKQQNAASCCIPELVQLGEAVEKALQAEGAADMVGSQGQLLEEEPESEHPTVAEALEASLSRMPHTVASHIVWPIAEGAGGPAEAAARQLLPAFSQEATGMLKKTWRLARIRGQRVQQLTEDLEQLTKKLTAQAASIQPGVMGGEGEQTKLFAAKKAVKAKDWELANIRQKLDQLERDRSHAERKLLAVERAKQREVWQRGADQRRLAELEAEVARAAEQREEFRRRLQAAKTGLCSAQVALDDAREALVDAEKRREELRAAGNRRAAELEAQLTQSQMRVQELQSQLEQRDAVGGGDSPSLAVSMRWSRDHRLSTLEVVQEEEAVLDDSEEEYCRQDSSDSGEEVMTDGFPQTYPYSPSAVSSAAFQENFNLASPLDQMAGSEPLQSEPLRWRGQASIHFSDYPLLRPVIGAPVAMERHQPLNYTRRLHGVTVCRSDAEIGMSTIYAV